MPSSRSSPRGTRGGRGAPPAALRELIEISRAVGGDPDLVQGGGGNTSVKTGDSMFVKASGTPLSRVDEERGWAELALSKTRAILEDPDLPRLPAEEREPEVRRLLERSVIRPRGARPSVESSLHALLERVVIHTHPVGLNALLSSKDSRKRWEEALSRLRLPAPPLYVPYVDPGYTLARRVKEEIERYERKRGRRPAVVLLENHGLFVAAEDARGALDLSARLAEAGARWVGRTRVNPLETSRAVEPRGERRSKAASAAARRSSLNGAGAGAPGGEALVRGALLRGGSRPIVARRDRTDLAGELVRSGKAVALARRGSFTPDQIVYCGGRPLVIATALGSPSFPRAAARAVESYRKQEGADPRVVIVKGEGVFYAAPDLAKLRVVSEVYRSGIATILSAEKGGGPRFLGRREREFIETLEGPAVRAEAKELEGRIAAVTGAGSGLGKGIALGLIAAGATVIGLDVDAAALEETMSSEPEGRFIPVRSDVTDERSVERAFETAEASAGGLDCLVNAAGIAPAHPLVEFPVDAWRKALEINLTGYFLCAREAAKLLIRQGAGGSIINLTSKSGLEASKDNSAYNATKAGEIHLMRGWALELGREGIRVNCVAPGNVFRGSKIWNAEYIRVCARKKGIRPEEVIPYYTSLSPLGKEIEPEDIASAVVFLCSEKARNITGQTLVVDGGQVMVR